MFSVPHAEHIGRVGSPDGDNGKRDTMSITVYTKPACVQCNATYRALDKAGIDAGATLGACRSALRAITPPWISLVPSKMR